MKILTGIDDSKSSADVVKAIVAQFRPDNTEVRVLHVLQPGAPAPPQMAAGYAPELEEQKKPAAELVERIAKELRSAGFKVETAVEVGDVRETIIDAAAACACGPDRSWFTWAESHPAFLAGQRGRIRRSPRQVLGRNRSLARECLTEGKSTQPLDGDPDNHRLGGAPADSITAAKSKRDPSSPISRFLGTSESAPASGLRCRQERWSFRRRKLPRHAFALLRPTA